MASAESLRASAGAGMERILRSAVRQLALGSPADVSLHDIAAEAGVSKALIHYHFHDRDTLLVAVADRLADELVTREADALHDERSSLAVDALWQWLRCELERGDIRVLLSLGALPGATVRVATQRAAARRREAAARTIARLFDALDLEARMPVSLIADVVVAFIDGLALEATNHGRDARVTFDVFWLALLSLGE